MFLAQPRDHAPGAPRAIAPGPNPQQNFRRTTNETKSKTQNKENSPNDSKTQKTEGKQLKPKPTAKTYGKPIKTNPTQNKT